MERNSLERVRLGTGIGRMELRFELVSMTTPGIESRSMIGTISIIPGIVNHPPKVEWREYSGGDGPYLTPND